MPTNTMDYNEVDIEHDFKTTELINPHARIGEKWSMYMLYIYSWRYT